MNKSEIKKRLLLVEQKIKYKKENCALEKYNVGDKVHKKQLQFHKCAKKNRWVFGGNRTGKTECGAVETLWLARGIHPYKQNKKDVSCWVVSLTTQVQRDVAQSKILHYLNKDWIVDIVMLSGKKSSPSMGVIDTILIKNVFGGISKIGFKSVDQGREKFQGASLDFVWFDEEPPYDIYLECKMRVIDREGEIFGTMTPLKGLTWVYNTIYLNEGNSNEVWYMHMQWEDNPFLSKKDLDELQSTLSEEELNERKYGMFSNHGGIVYSEFNENVNVIEPFVVPVEWYDKISIDPGYKNPLSAHWYAVDFDGNVYVIAEHYEKDKTIEYHAKKIEEISDKLNWHRSFGGKLEALIDSAANQRTLSGVRSVAELFADYNIAVNPKVNKDLFTGIQRVKSYFKNANGETKLYIFKTCVNMIREIKGYFWGKDDVPVKRDDHALDELRYYIMSRPENTKRIEKSVIQRDKEKKYREIKMANRY